MSARARPTLLVVGLAAVLAGCGGGDAGVTTISGQPTTAGGMTTYRGRSYTLSVPPWKPFVSRSPQGRIATSWSTPGTGNFVVLVTDDPHPVSLEAAVNASLQGSRNSYHPTTQAVLTAHVPGARAAKLITTAGPHGTGPYHAKPQTDANLIVTTPSGTMIDVLVVSHGAGNPDPESVIDSFRLAS